MSALIVDSREAKAHPVIIAQLKRLFDPHPIVVDGLIEFGDFWFEGADCHPTLGRRPKIGIELATVSDFIGKISSGRLSFQLSGMIDRYDIRVLLLESPLSADRNGYVYCPGSPSRFQYSRAMETLFAAQSHGVIVQYAMNRDDVANRIHSMFKYWSKPYEEHKSFRPAQLQYDAVIPLGEALDARVSNLMGLPGIGEQRAKDALALYKSLGLIYALPDSALKLIPGWGAATATRVHKFIHTNIETGDMNSDDDGTIGETNG